MDKRLLKEVLGTLKYFNENIQEFLIENLIFEYLDKKQIRKIIKINNKNEFKIIENKLIESKHVKEFNKKDKMIKNRLKKLILFSNFNNENRLFNFILNTNDYKWALSILQTQDNYISNLMKIFILMKLYFSTKDIRFLVSSIKIAKENNVNDIFKYLMKIFEDIR